MKKVWLVIQNQSESEYDKYVVNVVDSEQKAIDLCKEYNKEYSENVELKDGLFVKLLDYYNYHFYNYISKEVE